MVSKLLFPLHEWLKGHSSVKKRVELEQSQWLTPESLTDLQQQRLTSFLTHLQKHNKYFQRVFSEQGLGPDDFTDKAVLQRLPLLDKASIRANEQDLVSDDCKTPRFMSTSGSSGTPLRFVLGKARISHDIAAKWRATRWWNVDIGDREAVVWGSNIELSGQDRLKRWRDKLMRSKLFPARHLDDEGLAKLLDDLHHFKPAMIYGYPSILTLLAEHARKVGRDCRFTGLKVIFCTAEKLYPKQRQVIQEVFGAPVANGYGSRDAGFIAHECPHGGLHICAEDIIVEVLDNQGKPCEAGDIGELVVTHLATGDFPMLRYKTGDLATLSDKPCACGRGLPQFIDVVGRANDVLRATSGAAVHGSFIGNVVREDGSISNFQLVQEAPTQFLLRLVLYPGTKADLHRMERLLTKVLGQDANIDIEVVEQIPPEATGKYKYIINRCTG